VPPGVQSDVPVSVTWPNLRTGSNDWVADPKKMADGVIAARTLFSGEALQSVMRVINLSDKPYNLRKNEQLGEATQAEIWTSGFDTATMTVPSRNAGLADRAGPDAGPSQNVSGGADSVHTIDQESNDVCAHVQCLVNNLPFKLTDHQREEAVQFIRVNAAVFSKSEYDLGHTDLVEHQINTGDNRSVRQALR